MHVPVSLQFLQKIFLKICLTCKTKAFSICIRRASKPTS
ncbi:hypothetical protein [Escherichia phage pEC-M719-6WT.1]|uniref:Uncharacterized protein n=1 Tax=Escherichia phage pEC-M719-6WT.1 TaxID=3056220 RepID=A0AA51YCU1_9CAUD|nr:hypothetical protein [Escherichia phage pEC-M719-6WT.1]